MLKSWNAMDLRQKLVAMVCVLLGALGVADGMVMGPALSQIAEKFNLELSQSAILLGGRGVSGILGIIFGIGMMFAADRFGRLKPLIAAGLLSAAGISGLALSPSLGLALTLTIIGSFASGFILPLGIGLICETGSILGRQMAALIAASTSLLVGLFGMMTGFLSPANWETNLLAIAAMIVAATLSLFALPSSEQPSEQAEKVSSRVIGSGLLEAIPPILLVAISLLVFGMIRTMGMTANSLAMSTADVSFAQVGARAFAAPLGGLVLFALLLTNPSRKVMIGIAALSGLMISADVATATMRIAWPHGALLLIAVLGNAALIGTVSLAYAACATIIPRHAMSSGTFIVLSLSTLGSMLGGIALALLMNGGVPGTKAMMILGGIGLAATLIFALTLSRYAFLVRDEGDEGGALARFS